AEAAATIAKSFPGRRPAPTTMVVFGAAGDLTKRLVAPALYNLVRGGKLPEGFALIGIDRNDETTEAWCGNLTNMIQAFARAGGGGGGWRRGLGRGSSFECIICREILRRLKLTAGSRSC